MSQSIKRLQDIEQGLVKFETSTKKLLEVNSILKDFMLAQKAEIGEVISLLRASNLTGAFQLKINGATFMINFVSYNDVTHALFNLSPVQGGENPLPAPSVDDLHRLRLLTLGEMTAGIIHDINNPLNLVNSSAEICGFFLEDYATANASEQAEIMEKAKEQLQNVRQGAMRILEVSEGVRMLMHKNQVKFQNQELKKIVQSSSACCLSFLRQSGVEINFKDNTKSSIISCKESLLAQVVINLVKNSHDAVKSLPSHKKFIELSLNETDTSYELRVKDGGGGIDPQVASRIFEPFYTTKEMGEGTGIGLSLCRQIIETHQGTLELDLSAKNTTFVIILPKKRAA